MLLSTVAYEHNDLVTAETHARATEEIRYICTPIAYLQSAFVYASIYQVRGRQDLAKQKLQLAFDFLKETRNERLNILTDAFQMELAARQGDLSAPSQWAATIGPYVPLTLMPYFYAPQLTLPKILLAQGTPASLKQAATVLSSLYDSVTANHNVYFTAAVLALDALRNHAQGNAAKAQDVLHQALTLAQPGALIRMFVDLGTEMAVLLRQLRADGAMRSYVEKILRAFVPEPAAPQAAPGAAYAPHAAMVEPLTRREQEVLMLLAQRLTSGEIAERLVLSEQTVKRHRANIYQKLAVNSRREAIEAARVLGLLPPS